MFLFPTKLYNSDMRHGNFTRVLHYTHYLFLNRYQGSPVCHFRLMWTHHDVTLQQQCRFNGHTQTPAASALKVTVDITMYTQMEFVTKHGQTSIITDHNSKNTLAYLCSLVAIYSNRYSLYAWSVDQLHGLVDLQEGVVTLQQEREKQT